MPRITETIVTTSSEDGVVHIAPMGLSERGPYFLLAPFHPSQTLGNLRRDRAAVINLVSDVRVFAGCIVGRRDWPCRRAHRIDGWVLRQAASHRELRVEQIEDDPERPRFLCRQMYFAQHLPFLGYNRAQAAVIEAAVLISRLQLLEEAQIRAEMAFLERAVVKTAGPAERQAWDWLTAAMETYYASQNGSK